MTPPRRFRRAVLPWPLLFTSLALATADAQEQTARLVKDANREPGNFHAGINWVMPVGERVVFPMDTLAQASELWTSDGTPKGTRLLKDITPGPGGSYPENPVAFGSGAGAKVAFLVDRFSTGDELWVTDGTEAGTTRVFESPVSGYAGETALRAGTTGGVFFEDDSWDLTDPHELRFTDGTVAGTWSLNPIEGDGRARFSAPLGYVASGPWCYFIANDYEIWRSDGTDAGTTKVTTFTDGWPDRLALAGGRLFIQGGMDYYDRELWTCPMDGGELTRVGPPDGTTWLGMDDMAALDDELFFITGEDVDHFELWASDGTEAGTRRIPLVHPGQDVEPHAFGGLMAWKGSVYFSARRDDGSHELWRSDGTAGGTARLAAFEPGSAGYLWPYDRPENAECFYFVVDPGGGIQTLWQTQGDAASTRPVKGAPTTTFYAAEGPMLALTGSEVFFAAGQGMPEAALWRLRGKPAGAVRLTRPETPNASGIPSHPPASLPYEMLDGTLLEFVDTGRSHELWRMKPDGKQARAIWKAEHDLTGYGQLGFRGITASGAIFSYYDGEELNEVWVTDGTRRGTRMLANHGAAVDGGRPFDFVMVNGVCFYSVFHEDPAKAGLWKTDGTPGSTMKIVAADGSSPFPSFGEIVAFEDGVCFLSRGADGKTALWRSDGTTAGTVKLKDAWHGGINESAGSLSVVGGKLFFAVRLTSDVLWQSDGTAAGTMATNPLISFVHGSISPALDLGGVAVFQAKKFSGPLQWYRYLDGETRPVRNNVFGQHLYAWDEYSQREAVAGTRLFYTGLQEAGDAELWATDGTAEGSRRVKDLYPGPLGSGPDNFLTVGNAVYFTAYDEDHGYELWRSDGTEAGTVLVADVEPGPESSYPFGLKVMGGKLYFHAIRRTTGRELYSIDLPAE